MDLIALPKTELHLHLDGSIPLELTWQLMTEYRLNPRPTREETERLLTMQPEDETSLLAYLDKFNYPLWITQFYENIQQATFAILDKLASLNVTLSELRYSPIVHTYAGLTVRQAIRAVLSGMNHARTAHGMRVGLIVIAMRQHGPHIAKILARQAIAEGQQFHGRSGVVGFDIAGAERGNPPGLFREAFLLARQGGLGLTVHAGRMRDPGQCGRRWMSWAPGALDMDVPPCRTRRWSDGLPAITCSWSAASPPTSRRVRYAVDHRTRSFRSRTWGAGGNLRGQCDRLPDRQPEGEPTGRRGTRV